MKTGVYESENMKALDSKQKKLDTDMSQTVSMTSMRQGASRCVLTRQDNIPMAAGFLR